MFYLNSLHAYGSYENIFTFHRSCTSPDSVNALFLLFTVVKIANTWRASTIFTKHKLIACLSYLRAFNYKSFYSTTTLNIKSDGNKLWFKICGIDKFLKQIKFASVWRVPFSMTHLILLLITIDPQLFQFTNCSDSQY